MGSVSGKGKGVFSFLRGNSSERRSKQPQLLAREVAETKPEETSPIASHVAGMSEQKIKEYATFIQQFQIQNGPGIHIPSQDFKNGLIEARALRELLTGGKSESISDDLQSTIQELRDKNTNPSIAEENVISKRIMNLEALKAIFSERQIQRR